MTRHLLPLLASLIAFSVAHGQQPANVLEGTWEMVSQKLIYADSTVDRTDQTAYTVKILNSTHWAFGRQMDDQEEVFAGGGWYEFDGDTYTEHIIYHSGGLAGQSVRFDARIDGDTWHHSGDLGDFILEEVWTRIGAGPSGPR